ncbi:CXXC1 [Mytilus coruscus]|uniref:CXXC1 n=1 Tax=Mytilus coruscus TaxID=42192 RepID=A0A6J8EU59_MYTCO|nr:CXXC1 [Mytilus coruscus]
MAETMKLTITTACNVQNGEKEDINHKGKVAPSNKEIDKNPKQQDDEFDEGEDQQQQQQNEISYKCPIYREESEDNTIACDECNEWFHYTCLTLTEMEIRKIDPDIPYICDLCNDEALFRSTITKSDRDSNQHQVPNQPPSKYVKLHQQPINAIVKEDKSENNEARQTTNLDLPIIELDKDEGTQSALYKEEDNINRETKQRAARLEQKHTQMDSNNPEGESDIMNRQSLHLVEEQTSVKQPLEGVILNAYENNRNIDKQNQKQTVKRSNTKKQQNRKLELEQIAYISSLEQHIKNQDKTIDLLKKTWRSCKVMDSQQITSIA